CAPRTAVHDLTSSASSPGGSATRSTHGARRGATVLEIDLFRSPV
ncbi:MAG: hypothetical protein AVDCRST_MAG57-127, partial [uncultured Blastococcus sp.]